jgi:hypothetical protein
MVWKGVNLLLLSTRPHDTLLFAFHAVYNLHLNYTGCHNQALNISVPRAAGPATGCSDSVLRGFPDSFHVNAVIIPSTGARCGTFG